MQGFPILHYLPGFAQTHVHWVGDAIQSSHPLSPTSLSALNISQHQGLFQWVGSCNKWPKYWSFSLCINPFNEYWGLISFWIEWFHLFALQETLKSLIQHHNSKASILWHWGFFMVHPDIHTWTLKNPHLRLYRCLLAKWCLSFLIACLGFSQLYFQGASIF